MKSKGKKEIIEWVLVLTIIGIIYIAGWHTEILGRFQQVVLSTKLIQAEQTNELKTADLNFELISSGGEVVKLSDFEGQVIFINFWATWCPPCIAELPNIQSLYDDKKEEAVFIMLSLDRQPEKAESFINRKGYSFPVFFPKSTIPETFSIKVVPTTYLVGRDGKIHVHHEGMANYDTEDFRKLINELAKSENTL